jgi:hypothetical protein
MKLLILDKEKPGCLSLYIASSANLPALIEEVCFFFFEKAPSPLLMEELYQESKYFVYSESARWLYEKNPIPLHIGVDWEVDPLLVHS